MRRAAGPLALFLFGLLVSLYYGRRGYMPLDQSIVFDGGWRILSGQVPFRDYHAPNGFVPHAMQAVFFAVLGVTWFAYCLHAAVINGLFAVLVQRVLKGLGLAGGLALAYGALSALVLYPPFGVPYMDQHAFFFSLLAVAAALCGRRKEEAESVRWTWLLLPTVLLLAGLSKQIPSVFALPVVLVIALFDTRAKSLRRLGLLATGTAAALGLLAVLGMLVGVELERLDLYARQLPSKVGESRYGFVPGLVPLVERMRHTADVLGLHSIRLIHAFAGLSIAALVLLWKARRRDLVAVPFRAALLAEALLVTCLLFIALTSNQPEIGVPFVFLAAGLIHLALERTYDGLVRMRAGWLALAARVLGGIVLVVALRDGWVFTSSVNATRVVNDFDWDPVTAAISAPRVHPDLEFMRWQLPASDHVARYGPAHLADLVEALKEKEHNVLLLSDASIVYGLAGKPSAAPSLWFHPGLTLPMFDDERLADYEQLLLERMDELAVRFVVLDGDHTWIGVSLEHFPRLKERIESRRVGPGARFGPFELIDLGAS
jgi:hypothetical protein